MEHSILFCHLLVFCLAKFLTIAFTFMQQLAEVSIPNQWFSFLNQLPPWKLYKPMYQNEGLLYIFHAIEIVEIARPATAYQPNLSLAHHPITCMCSTPEACGPSTLPPVITSERAFFFFYIKKKIKISKIYVCFEIFQNYPWSPGWQALNIIFFL